MDIGNLALGCLFLVVGTIFATKHHRTNKRGAVIKILGGLLLALGFYLILFCDVSMLDGESAMEKVKGLRAVFN